jgi:flagellar hook protein FlgE
MSINTALLAGTSGLRANASALAATSDNIANANTIGYKRVRNDFTALLVQQNQFTSYNAAGVTAGTTSLVGEQGALGSSNNATHLAVSGDGLFVARQKAADAESSDGYFFTRSGQFSPDSEGYLQNTAGYYLQGWPIGVPTGPTDLGALEPVRVSNIGGAAEATSNVAFSANLQASQEVSAAAAGYDLATNPNASMASGDFTPDFQSTVQVYDSLGGIRTLAFSFMKSATNANEWNAEIHVVPASDVQASGLPDGLMASGVVAFTPFGQLDPAATTLPSSISIGASDTAVTSPNVGWATASGLAAQTLSLDIGGALSSGGITQYDTPSALDESTVDGRAYGVLSTVEVDKEGFVNALFTNGLSRPIYQLPLATFANPSELISAPGGAYTASPNAGQLNMKAANEAGAGLIQSRSLEASTVDLAEEFTNLITTQRAYSASSKIVTTADEMLDELIRIKR